MANDIERDFGSILVTPDLFPFRLDFVQRAILFVRISPEALRKAPFLDQRLLPQNAQGAWIDLEKVLAGVAEPAASAPALTPIHFLLHISHCGSTLLSRMIDEATGALGLREPLPLRDLALAQDRLGQPDAVLSENMFDQVLNALLTLWRRPSGDAKSGPHAAVVIKPTSSCQRLAHALSRLAPNAKTITLHLPAESHMATLLGGPNNIYDMRAWGPERMARLISIAGPPPSDFHALSPGELAALTWASERLWQKQLLADPDLKPRLLDVDFDRLLAAPSETLGAVCSHLGLQADPDYLARLPEAPVMRTYAKAPEHAYSTELREQVLQQARRECSGEIAKGLAWLKAYAQTAPEDLRATLADAAAR